MAGLSLDSSVAEARALWPKFAVRAAVGYKACVTTKRAQRRGAGTLGRDGERERAGGLTARALRFAVVAALSVALFGCSDPDIDCAPGFTLVGGKCVGDGDGGGADAGPCSTPCTGTTPICRSDGVCVGCLEDMDCADRAAAKCDLETGTCRPCDDTAQCTRPGVGGVCASAGAHAGECVECTAAEPAACSANPCNDFTNACSEFGRNAQAQCAPCDTDDNCTDSEHFCVPMQFMGAARAQAYCLKATPGCREPFTVVLSGRTSASGVAGQSYCAVNEAYSTCEAVNALLTNASCPSGTDAECPEGGLCRTLDPMGVALMHRCTYQCAGPTQCDVAPNPGKGCGVGDTTSVTYCGG